jgi:O-acetyl-ADP-ribose deacetylase (regulator of RNase III)
MSSRTPVNLTDLPTWQTAGPDYYRSTPLPPDPPLYPISDAINSKLSFWMGGDSAALAADAIVNAANSGLSAGRGICGVIHSAAGPELEDACQEIGHTPTGQAALTPGFRLPAKYVIHAVGPMGEDEELLTSAYKSTLAYLDGDEIKSIGFCCISTGIFGYPIRPATHVALKTVREFLDVPENLEKTERIIFVVFEPRDVAVYYELAPLYFPLTAIDETEEVKGEDAKKDEVKGGEAKKDKHCHTF